MKKMFFVLCFVFISFICIKGVTADSISLKTNKEFYGKSVTVDVEIKTDTKVAGALFPISYDKKKLVDVTLTGKNGFNATLGENMLFDHVQDATGTKVIGTFTFTVSDDFKVGEETTITLNKGSFSNTDLKEWEVNGASVTIKRIAEPTPDPEQPTPEQPTPEQPTPEQPVVGNPAYACKKIDGLYYDKNGLNVSKLEFEKVCPIENSDTGFGIPLFMLIWGISFIIFITLKNKENIRLRKI